MAWPNLGACSRCVLFVVSCGRHSQSVIFNPQSSYLWVVTKSFTGRFLPRLELSVGSVRVRWCCPVCVFGWLLWLVFLTHDIDDGSTETLIIQITSIRGTLPTEIGNLSNLGKDVLLWDACMMTWLNPTLTLSVVLFSCDSSIPAGPPTPC